MPDGLTPSAAIAPAAIHTQDLGKRYGKTVALAGLTLTVRPGEVFGFLGPNGAGKTTAVKLLIGLTRPSFGEGWVLGAPIGDRTTRRRVGYLPELFRYQTWLSAREVLSLHCELMQLPRPRRQGEIDAALHTVGLAERGDDRVGTFSKGMQQRLGLGVALLGKPELIVLDEPTSALDPVGRHEVRAIIRELKATGATIFLNSHLLTEVEQVCDRVAIVDRGRVIATGSLGELLDRGGAVRMRVGGLSQDQYTALGLSRSMNREGEWLTFANLGIDGVADLVAEAVRLGGKVYAVEPRQLTLEDRFLQLLKDAE